MPGRAVRIFASTLLRKTVFMCPVVVILILGCFYISKRCYNSNNFLQNKVDNDKAVFGRIRRERYKVLDKDQGAAANRIDKLYNAARRRLTAFAENPTAILMAEVRNTADRKIPVWLSCGKSLLLLIVVLSRPDSLLKRQSIRATWGDQGNEVNKYIREKHLIKLSWKTIFVLGLAGDKEIARQVEKEQHVYQDILTLNYVESFRNLTSKTLHSLEWVSKNCNAKYVLKTDDDCLVNVRKLLPWLNKLHARYNYIGKVQSGMAVVRDINDRYHVPFSDYPNEFYPEYCSGGGYILKRDILPDMIQTSKKIKLIVSEDAYIGILMQKLKPKIHFKHDQRFLPFIYDENLEIGILHPCQINYAFIIHDVIEFHQLNLFFSGLLGASHKFLCDNWGEGERPSQRPPTLLN